jgi:hypothetical protein
MVLDSFNEKNVIIVITDLSLGLILVDFSGVQNFVPILSQEFELKYIKKIVSVCSTIFV